MSNQPESEKGNAAADSSSNDELSSPITHKTRAELAAQNAKTVKKLVFVVVGMLGFSFALVPLYDVFCDLTGLNGKPSDQAAIYESVEIDTSRMVKVEFILVLILTCPGNSRRRWQILEYILDRWAKSNFMCVTLLIKTLLLKQYRQYHQAQQHFILTKQSVFALNINR